METATITHSDTRSWANLEQLRNENEARIEALEKEVGKHFSKLIFDHCLEETIESARTRRVDRLSAPKSIFSFVHQHKVYQEALKLSDAESFYTEINVRKVGAATKKAFPGLVKAYNETHPNLRIGSSIKWTHNKRALKAVVWPKK